MISDDSEIFIDFNLYYPSLHQTAIFQYMMSVLHARDCEKSANLAVI
ncbi:MAG: hypothetical protein ACTSWL_03090 [Promethearchaeota archaeon]